MNVNHTCALQNPLENRGSINRGRLIYRVNRLQGRIAKAVREGKWGKNKIPYAPVCKDCFC